LLTETVKFKVLRIDIKHSSALRVSLLEDFIKPFHREGWRRSSDIVIQPPPKLLNLSQKTASISDTILE